MKKILLATVAAIPLLAAGMMPASSQDIRQPGQGKQGMSQSQSQGRAGAQEKAAPEKNMSQSQGRAGAQEKSAQEKQGAARGAAESGAKSSQAAGGQDKAQPRTEGRATGQEQTKEKAGSESTRQGQAGAENRGTGQAAKGKAQQQPSAGAKSQASEGQNKSNQSNARNQASEGQNKSSQNNPKQTNGAQNAPARTTGQANRPNQATQPNQANQPNNQPNQANQQNNERGQTNERAQQNAAGGETSGRVTLNQDQRTKIEQSVLSGRDVPRVDRVNFSINVGAVVPREVRVVELPETLVEINPRWRGFEYFVVRDEIYIVDHSRRIVALVPVRESSGSVETRGTSTADLSEVDIRRMQEVLIEKGFFHGRVDGRFGPETRRALISFQQREGIEASGRLDERTFAALGISSRSEGRANQNEERGRAGGESNRPSTSGQGANMPSGGENKAPGQNNPPSASSQGGKAPSAGESKAPGQNNRPSTSGQGGASSQSGTSGQGGKQPSANESKGSGQQGQSTQPQNQNPSSGKAGGTSDDQRRRQ